MPSGPHSGAGNDNKETIVKAVLRIVPALALLAACGGGSAPSSPSAPGTAPTPGATAPGTGPVTAPADPATPPSTPSTPDPVTVTPPTDTATPPSTPADPPVVTTPPVTTTPPVVVTPPVASRWAPRVTDTWHWQLTGTLDTRLAVDVYDIDLFDTPQATIDGLKARGVRVVCYFSAGSAEDWRADYGSFKAADLGAGLDGWAGERWVDTRSDNVRAIMGRRLDVARDKGCDGVEPDNMDAYINRPGLPLTAATQLDYNLFLAREAHARNLAIGLKNDVDQLAQLAPHFDFAVNEQCFQYAECGGYTAFTSLGKPVFNAEYAARYRDNTNGARDALCQDAARLNIRTLVLPLALDNSFRMSCDR